MPTPLDSGYTLLDEDQSTAPPPAASGDLGGGWKLVDESAKATGDLGGGWKLVDEATDKPPGNYPTLPAALNYYKDWKPGKELPEDEPEDFKNGSANWKTPQDNALAQAYNRALYASGAAKEYIPPVPGEIQPLNGPYQPPANLTNPWAQITTPNPNAPPTSATSPVQAQKPSPVVGPPSIQPLTGPYQPPQPVANPQQTITTAPGVNPIPGPTPLQREAFPGFSTSPIPKIPINPEDAGVPINIPGFGTVSTKTAKTIANTITGQITPENAAMVLGAEIGAAGLAALRTAPKMLEFFSQYPNLAKAVDIGSRATVPGLFGAAQTGQGINEAHNAYVLAAQGKTDEAQDHLVSAFTNLIMGLMSFVGAYGAGKGGAALYPKAGEPVTMRGNISGGVIQPEEVGGIAKPANSQQAGAVAQNLAEGGNPLAAQAWERLDFSRPVEVQINGEPHYISAPQRVPGRISGRPAVYQSVTDAQGEVVYGGTPSGLRDWLISKQSEVPLHAGEVPIRTQDLQPTAQGIVQHVPGAEAPPLPTEFQAPTEAPPVSVEAPVSPPTETPVATETTQPGPFREPASALTPVKGPTLPNGVQIISFANPESNTPPDLRTLGQHTVIAIKPGANADIVKPDSQTDSIIGNWLTANGYSPGDVVGTADVVPNDDGSGHHSEGTYVAPAFQRQGIATAMYDHAANIGAPLSPAPVRTEDADALWVARNEPKANIPAREEPAHAPAPATANIPAQEPAVKSGESGEDVIRGSVNIPLSPAGQQQAQELGDRVKAKGGFTSVTSSDFVRAQQTATPVAAASGVQLQTTDQLHPMYMGSLEGQPTSKVLAKINDQMINHPDEKFPGRGEGSTKDGESPNDFFGRVTNYLKNALAEYQANPQTRPAFVTHFRDLRAIQSIIKTGKIDTHDLTERGTNNEPGSVHRIWQHDGKWRIAPVNMKPDTAFAPGVYIIRHGVTAFNGENPGGATGQVVAQNPPATGVSARTPIDISAAAAPARLSGSSVVPFHGEEEFRHLPPPPGERISPLRPFIPESTRRSASGALVGSLERLRRNLARDPNVGSPQNLRTVFKDAQGEFAVGRITPADWRKRAATNLTPAELHDARQWYHQLEDFFEKEFGKEEGPKVALAWLLSQQNESPSGGMRNVARVMDQLRGLPKLGYKAAGLAEDKIRAALEGNPPEKGYDAKLSDFVDSALGKTTRTIMGDDPRGGEPAVIDVWANRDVGKVDQRVLSYIAGRFGEQAAKSLKADGEGIGETDYEYGARFYNDVARGLNARNVDGGKWTAAEVQAVGWTAMQKAMGATPEFPRDLITKNTRRVSIGLGFGSGAPLGSTYPAIPYEVADNVLDSVASKTGVRILRSERGSGAYMGEPKQAIQVEAFGSLEAIYDFMVAAGYGLQQTEVIATRPLKSGNRMFVDLVEGNGTQLANPKTAQEFFGKLAVAGPHQMTAGFQQATVDGKPAIRVLNFGGNWSDKLVQQYANAAAAVAKEYGVELDVSRGNIVLESAKNDWKESPNGGEYASTLVQRGRQGLSGWMERSLQPAVEADLARHAGKPVSRGAIDAARSAGYRLEEPVDIQGYRPIDIPHLPQDVRNRPYVSSAPTSLHANNAAIARLPLEGRASHLADAYVVNPSAMELVGRAAGKPADYAGRGNVGLHINPKDTAVMARNLGAITGPDIPQSALRLRQAFTDAAQVGKSVILISDHPFFEQHQQTAIAEELSHAMQASMTGGTRTHLGKGLSAFTDHPLFAKAADTLAPRYPRQRGTAEWENPDYNWSDAAEVGARLMRPRGYQELGLTPDEARVLAAHYVRTLRREYGSAKPKEIAREVFSAFQQSGREERGVGTPSAGQPRRSGTPEESGLALSGHRPGEQLPSEQGDQDERGAGENATTSKAVPRSVGERGSVPAHILTAPLQSAEKFVKADVLPVAKAAAQTLTGSFDEVRKLLAPQTRGPQAQYAGGLVREVGGELAQRRDRAVAALAGAREYFEKQPLDRRFEVIHAIETGDLAKLNPKERGFVNTMRGLFAQREAEIKKLGLLNHFLENYFPHIWKEPEKAEQWVRNWQSKAPLAGKESFRKRRTIPTIKEGMDDPDFHLVPAFDNPVDFVLSKLGEEDKSITAHQAFNELKDGGLIKYLPAGEKLPPGQAYIDDRLFKVAGPKFGAVGLPEGAKEAGVEPGDVRVFGRREMGRYVAPEPLARVINNHLMPGLNGSDLLKAWGAVNRTLNMLELSVSWFHGMTTALNSTFSDIALGLAQLEAGKPVAALKSTARGLLPFASVVDDFLKGRKLQQVWRGKRPPANDVEAALVDALKAAGGRASVDKFWTTSYIDNVAKAWREDNVIGAAIRLPFAAMEAFTKPLMEGVVPRAKIGAFMKSAQLALDQNPLMTRAEMRKNFGDIWDSMDNRFGQLNQANLFFNPIVKGALNAVVGRPGWNIGSVSELGGGMADLVGSGIRAAKGDGVHFSNRSRYLIAAVVAGMVINGLANFAFTGEAPKDIRDLIAPRDGGTTEDGHPSRAVLPMYLSKDIYSYATNFWGTLRAKAAPVLSIISSLAANKAFPNEKIYGQGGEGLAQFLKGYWEPYSLQGIEKNVEREEPASKILLPNIGINPAGRKVGLSAAETVLADYIHDQQPQGPRNAGDVEKSQIRNRITNALRAGNDDKAWQISNDAIGAGKITDADAANAAKRARMTPLEADFHEVPLDIALDAFAKATPDERILLRPIMDQKMKAASKTMAPAQLDALWEKLDAIR